MKLKNIIFLGFTFLIALCGCNNNNTPSIENDNLTIYSLDKLYFYNEYTVNDLENLVVYFPVATNKEITSTELGGVSAIFSINNASTNSGSFNVKLLTDKQDFINIKYNNYFISFLKYKIKFIGDADTYKYNSIVLNDTKIWIFCNEEIQSLDFIEDYLKINIANETDSQSLIDWEEKIREMKDLIESELE